MRLRIGYHGRTRAAQQETSMDLGLADRVVLVTGASSYVNGAIVPVNGASNPVP